MVEKLDIFVLFEVVEIDFLKLVFERSFYDCVFGIHFCCIIYRGQSIINDKLNNQIYLLGLIEEVTD